MNIQELIKEIEENGIYCLNVFGNEVKSIPVKRAIGLIKQLDEPKPVKVPQFVADWIEKYKTELSLREAMSQAHVSIEVNDWLIELDSSGAFSNQDIFARAWFDGYEVKKEKQYLVNVKGVNEECEYLFFGELSNTWKFRSLGSFGELKKYHTRKELEEAGFGWVFDCEGIEIEEVE